MKKIIFLIALYYSLFTTHYSLSQWVWQNPLPNSYSVKDIKFANANTLYMTQEYGVIMKSTNKGIDWFGLNYDSTANFGPISFLDGNTGFVAYKKDSKMRIIKTGNGGLSWTSLIVSNTWYSPISMFFLNSNTGFIGSQSSILYKTTNGGNNWDSTIVAYDSLFVLNNIYFKNASTGFITGWTSLQSQYWGRIFKTTNAGINWSSVTVPWIPQSLQFIGDTGYVFGGGYYYTKTVNLGASWDTVFVNQFQGIENAKFVNSLTGFITGRDFISDNVFISKTTNGGINWQKFNFFGYYDLSLVDAFGTNDIIAAGMGGTIIKSNNSGVSWINNSLPVNAFYDVSFPDQNTGYVLNNNVYLKTTNSGASWTADSIRNSYNKNLSNNGLVQFFDGMNGFMMKDSLYKTTNGGLTWNKIVFSGNRILRTFNFVNSNTGYAILDYFSYPNIATTYLNKTTNGGISWQETQYTAIVDFTKMHFFDENTGYAYTYSGATAYKKTTDGGLNWVNVNTGYNFNKIYFLNPLRGFLYGSNGLYLTTNGGVNFTSVFFDSAKVIFDLSFIDDNTGFLLMGDYNSNTCPKLYKTTNGGLNWNQSCTLFRNTRFYLLKFINVNTGFCFGEAGAIIKTNNGGGFIGVNQISSQVPAMFSLFQNYPNPFNPTTNIKYQIPKLSSPHALGGDLVLLKIYDILGKEIATLVNEKQNPGTYEVTFDGTVYPSGIYFYTLETQNYRNTKKMVLIK